MHRLSEINAIVRQSLMKLSIINSTLRELGKIPDNYKILYVHGGAQMQFSAIPLNLINLKPARKATFVLTGNWAVKASKEAARYGNCINIASSEDTNFDRIPEWDTATWILNLHMPTSLATILCMGLAGITSRYP